MKRGTIQYFNSQICEFRKLFGTRTFWANPKMVHNAKKAIATQYLEFQGSDDEEAQVVSTFLSTMSEFHRRADLIGFDLQADAPLSDRSATPLAASTA